MKTRTYGDLEVTFKDTWIHIYDQKEKKAVAFSLRHLVSIDADKKDIHFSLKNDFYIFSNAGMPAYLLNDILDYIEWYNDDEKE